MKQRTEQLINVILLLGIVIGITVLLFIHIPNYIYDSEQERFAEIKEGLRYDMRVSKDILEELKDMYNVELVHNMDASELPGLSGSHLGFYTAYFIKQGEDAGIFEHRIPLDDTCPTSYQNVVMFFDFSYEENRIP